MQQYITSQIKPIMNLPMRALIYLSFNKIKFYDRYIIRFKKKEKKSEIIVPFHINKEKKMIKRPSHINRERIIKRSFHIIRETKDKKRS